MTEAKLLIEELENAALGFPNTGNFKRCQDAKDKLSAYIEAMKTDFIAGVHEGKAQVQAEAPAAGPEVVSLEDGKYVATFDKGNLTVTRYGEPWRDLSGDKFVYLLFEEARLHQESLK